MKMNRLLCLALAAGCVWQCQAADWKRPAIEQDPTAVYTDPVLAKSYRDALDRMTQELLTKDFILADVNFNQPRRFTNFSGDISGRFIELTSSVSSADQPWPETLMPVLREITRYQKADGHFGKDIDWNGSVDFDEHSDQVTMMPNLWGNGRLLLGLTEAARKFDLSPVREAAQKLGDFYVNTVYPRFCDPKRMSEYETKAQYASAYITCVYEGMEGLVQLYRLTGEKRYLDTAVKMADFHARFDTLPTGHSHGSLSQTGALVMIYEDTGLERFLKRAEDRWEEAAYGGYVSPCGGVFEHFAKALTSTDEGCSEADWLRLNLLLWANTGKARYLDMAERLLWNEMMANQWPTGGFGHRMLKSDDIGAYAYNQPVAESYWCCTYHGALALHKLRSYLAVSTPEGIYINFPIAFETTVKVNGKVWNVKTKQKVNYGDQEMTDSFDSWAIEVEVTSTDKDKGLPPKVILRKPEWAGSCLRAGCEVLGNPQTRKNIESTERINDRLDERGKYLEISMTKVPDNADARYTAAFSMPCYLEPRILSRTNPDHLKLSAEPQKFEKSVLRYGPYVLMNKDSGDIQDLKLKSYIGGSKVWYLETPASNVVPYIELKNKEAHHAFLFNVETEPVTPKGKE